LISLLLCVICTLRLKWCIVMTLKTWLNWFMKPYWN
jgi:hypothetical protein